MNGFGPNTNPHPLEIEDARAAQHRASEVQREHSDNLVAAHFALADAEEAYNVAKVARIKQLKAEGWAATVCAEIAKGEEPIAHLRAERDRAAGVLAKLKDHAYTLGADRRALDGLMEWSMGRELRTDREPVDWRGQPTFGDGQRPCPVPDGVDPETGELRPAA